MTTTEFKVPTAEPSDSDVRKPRKLPSPLSPKNIGAVYLWAVIIIIFWIWLPDLFPQAQTAKNIANQYSITGLAALALILPLSTGAFDLSLGSVIGFSGVLAAWLLGNTTQNTLLVVALTLGCCLLIGAINAFIVVVLRIDSFIATLATGSIILAATNGISNNQVLFKNVPKSGLTSMSQTNWDGIQLPVLFLLAVAAILAFVLDRTKFGRFCYATGFNADAARLSGVPTRRVQAIALVTSAVVAGFAGLLLVGRIGSADPSSGPSYLIPAFAAAYAGATQFRGGRFNSWGALVAVGLIGTGTVGLSLASTPSWAPDAFLGVALLVAVGVARRNREAA
jgi:ribose transport system permease protein